MTPKLLRCRTTVKIVATLATLTLQQQMVQSVPNEQKKPRCVGVCNPWFFSCAGNRYIALHGSTAVACAGLVTAMMQHKILTCKLCSSMI